VSFVLTAVTLAYPAAVYFSMGHRLQFAAALVVAALAMARAVLTKQGFWWGCALGALLLSLGTLLRGDAALLKMYPVMVNAGMFVVFAISLWRPPCIIERLARLTTPDLPSEGVRYTCAVTRIWCVFFIVNGSTALYTALYTSERIWALYNGVVAYLLMGTLLLGERLWRIRAMANASDKVAPIGNART